MVWVWLVVGAALAATAGAAHLARLDAERMVAAEFEKRRAEILQAIRDRALAYEQVLRGGLGLFTASEGVTRSEWRAYVETLSIEDRYPGIQGIGYSVWIEPEERAGFEARVRAEGFPGFRIRPDGERGDYTSILYLEPFERRNQQAFGYDMWSEEVRRAAMASARDTARTRISGRVTLVQEIDEDVQAGFLMYLPYYGTAEPPATVEERREALIGFVYSPFRMRDFMAGIVGDLHDIALWIYDGDTVDPGDLMYDSERGSEVPHEAVFQDVRTIALDGHRWTVRTASLPALEAAIDSGRPHFILFTGALLSASFGVIVWSFASRRSRAEMIARHAALALDERIAELSRTRADLERFAYVASHDLKAPLRAIDNLAGWIEEDLDDVLDGESRENMSLLRGRVHRLEALLDGLLRYSRIGRVQVEIELVDTGALIRELFDLLNGEGRFVLALPAPLPVLQTARAPFEQVINNLITNAMKHHDRPTGELTVTVQEDDDVYRFAVADDGPGIPPQYHERVQRMFQTLRPRDEVEGSGMGLAIIRKTIDQQRGSLRIESDGRRGTTVHFTWPKAWRQEDPVC